MGNLRRKFKVGDFVKKISGHYEGRYGVVDDIVRDYDATFYRVVFKPDTHHSTHEVYYCVAANLTLHSDELKKLKLM